MKVRRGNKESSDVQAENKRRLAEIRALNEKLTLTNEELKVTNEELKAYQNKLEEIVAIRTHELKIKEDSLNYKSKLQKLVSGISTRFFNLSPEVVDNSIVNSLKEICTFFNGEAAFLGEIIYSENAYKLTHVWKNEQVQFNETYFQNGPISDIMWWLDKISEQEIFVVDYRARHHQKYALENSNHLSGTGQITFIPIIFQGNIVGFTGLSCLKSREKWEKDEITLLHQIGEVFVNAVKKKESEKILIENERNYREIFNATSEAIVIYDYKNRNIIDINYAGIKLFGITYEEALAADINLFSDTELGYTRESLLAQIDQTISYGSVVFEWHARRKNRDYFWVEVSLKNTEIAGDLRIIAVVRDITERKRVQEIIIQNEERFRYIVQFLTDIIIIIDKNLNITYESPSCSKVFGYNPGFLMGKSGLDIIHSEDVSRVTHDLREVFEKQNDHLPTEFRVKGNKDQWISIEAIADNMLDHPAIKGIIITGRDVTERRRVEKALKISETKFRDIFNNTSDPIVIISNKYKFLEVNEVFLRAAGYSLEETKKMKLTEIITDAYLPQLVEKLVKIFKNEYQPALECEIKCKEKRTFPAEINSKLIEFEGEVALIAVIRNITERRQIENRILDTIISTEEKEREKFARNLHDELGPLLSSIKMYVNSLSSSIEPSKHDFIIAQLKIILTEVIQSTKELSNDLSPHVLANYGLIAALEWFINQLKPYITITFETNLREERFASSLELSMYRIIKELINNTLKHAHATKINIKLFLILKSIHMDYSDNGKGFDENWQSNYEYMGMGMSNITSRCRSIHATSKFFNNGPNGMAFEMQVPTDDYIA